MVSLANINNIRTTKNNNNNGNKYNNSTNKNNNSNKKTTMPTPKNNNKKHQQKQIKRLKRTASSKFSPQGKHPNPRQWEAKREYSRQKNKGLISE